MSSMHIETETRGGWRVISVQGRVDSLTAGELNAALLAAVSANERVAVDCSGLEYISSMGIASLMEGARAARTAHREFRVCAPNQRVKQVFEITGLRSQLDVREDLPC
ncbi:MAG TPA: STAS domain-containing protein [Candidatus Saccharimonadales bacterium]|jgi:anti-sigma B factor antagonist|nr:STAS domain-containing protein [Candidatus Saccharimonadales bacterium]